MVEDIEFKEYIEDIESLFSPKSNYTFLVGAGISMDPPSNMPSAMQIVRGLLELCAPEDEYDKISMMDMLRFELVVEKIKDVFDEELRFLDYLDIVKEPNFIHLFLSNVITRGNYVVTTNFDYLIEQGLVKILDENWHQDIIPVITKEDFIIYQDPKSLVSSNKYPIYKIHGSKRNIITGSKTSESLVTTMSALGKDRAEGETFAIEPYKKPAIFNLMRERTLVVMGYSGSDDFDIGPTLKELPFLNRLIWIEHSQGSKIEVANFNKNKELAFKQNSSKLEQLLLEINDKNDFEVILIKTNTISFIKTKLWKIFLPYLPLTEFKTIESGKEIPNFKNWLMNLYNDLPLIQKYKFACQIFYYLKDLEGTERCSNKGFLLAEETNDQAMKSYFMNFLGLINQITGNYSKSLEYYEKAYEIDNLMNDLAGISTDLNNIGSIYLTLGKYDEALDSYNQALKIVERLDDSMSKITCINNIGRIYEIRNQFDLAQKKYLEAIKITEKIGDLNRKATILNNIGMIYKTQDNNNQALEYYNEALRISDLLGDIYGKIILLNNIGRVYDDNQEYEKALENYYLSVKFADQLGDPSKKAGCINNIGSVYLVQGKLDKALEQYQEALKIEEKVGDPLMMIIYLNNIGMIHTNRGNYILAKENYKQALSIAEDIGDLSKKGLLLTKIGAIDMIQEKNLDALEKYEEAALLFERTGESSNKAASLSNLGKIYESRHNYFEALRRYEEALSVDQNIGDLVGIASDFYNIGRIYNLQGEYRKALESYDNSLSIFTQLKQNEYINVVKSKIDEINKKIGK
ncbi:MAG: tetratricopeptide repeat protein [Promethearchaeota archaeon]